MTLPGGTTGPRATGSRRIGVRAALLAVLVTTAAGCAAFGPGRLDIPPGFRMVMGETDLRRLDAAQGLIELVREDGLVRYDLPVARAPATFVIPLPPGRYRVERLRVTDSGRRIPDEVTFELWGAFEVDAPAVYVGTLRIGRERFGTVSLVVEDEFDRTVPALQARYPEIPSTVRRALVRPGR